MNKGQKFDANKQQYYRMPLVMLKPLADVFCIAGVKYPAFNCLKPFDDGDRRLFDAMMRHAEASQIDPLAINEEDAGVYHLAQVAFSALTRLHNAMQQRNLMRSHLSSDMGDSGGTEHETSGEEIRSRVRSLYESYQAQRYGTSAPKHETAQEMRDRAGSTGSDGAGIHTCGCGAHSGHIERIFKGPTQDVRDKYDE